MSILAFLPFFIFWWGAQFSWDFCCASPILRSWSCARKELWYDHSVRPVMGNSWNTKAGWPTKFCPREVQIVKALEDNKTRFSLSTSVGLARVSSFPRMLFHRLWAHTVLLCLLGLSFALSSGHFDILLLYHQLAIDTARKCQSDR